MGLRGFGLFSLGFRPAFLPPPWPYFRVCVSVDRNLPVVDLKASPGRHHAMHLLGARISYKHSRVSAIYGCGYNPCGCNLRLSEVRSGSFGVDLGPVWCPKGSRSTPNGPRTTSNCSRMTCSHSHRSPKLELGGVARGRCFAIDPQGPPVTARLRTEPVH